MSVTGHVSEIGVVGLTRVARAIRRSVALYVATITSAEGTSDDDVLARADTFATWLVGRSNDDQERPPPTTFDPTA